MPFIVQVCDADIGGTCSGAPLSLLTVAKSGAGSGTVTSVPAGIDCGTICSASFASATPLALTGTPSPGSCFIGWSAFCSGFGACNLTLGSNTSLTATFEPVGVDFCDVTPGGWAENYINTIFANSVTTGCVTAATPQDRRFCPSDLVTRAQMAAFIVRAKEGEPPLTYCDTGSPFADVSASDQFCRYIKRLVELEITAGIGGGLFGPEDTVTREQMAAFLVRALNEVPNDGYCGMEDPFTDMPHSWWSCKYVKRLVELGITLGIGEGLYGPGNPVTRAEMAVFLARAFLGM